MPQTIRPSQSNAISFLRVLGCFFVVLLHAADSGTGGHPVLSCVCRFSVPVFVIISGYLLLLADKPLRSYAMKSAKLLVLALLASAIYYLYYLKTDRIGDPTAASFLRYLVTEPTHLWYLFTAIALYLVTPILAVFARHAEQKTYLYALFLGFLFGSVIVTTVRTGFVPTLAAVLERSKAPYAIGFLFLYLFGGYCRRFGIARKTQWCLAVLAVVLTAFAAVWTNQNPTSELLLSFYAPNAVVGGMAVFVCAFSLFQKDEPSRVLRFLASLTLGVYLIHILVLDRVSLYITGDDLLSTLGKAAVTTLFSAVIVAALQSILHIVHRKHRQDERNS